MNRLIWTPKALQEMAKIFEAASDDERYFLSPLVTHIERQLMTDPLSLGESRSGSERVVIYEQVVVWFDVVGSTVFINRVSRSRSA